jgi:CHAD domain-containing protein
MAIRETLEREVKLRAASEFKLPELGGEAIEPRVFVSAYHDTADHRLARRGVTLRHRVEHGDFQAEPVDGPDDASSAARLRARMREQAERVITHDPGTRLGTDSEELAPNASRDPGVAGLRPGRGRLLDPDWVESVRDELKWLGGALGPVRDLDVLVEHLTPEVESLGDDREHGRKLLRTLERSRRTARRRLIAALDSERYFALPDTLEQRVATIADAPTLEEILAAEHKRLRKAVQTLDDASSGEELQAVRIHVKRARYAAELSGAGAYVKAAKALQDVLGEHQDAVVAAERLRDLATRMPDTALAASRLVERERMRALRGRDEWRSAWKNLAKAA